MRWRTSSTIWTRHSEPPEPKKRPEPEGSVGTPSARSNTRGSAQRSISTRLLRRPVARAVQRHGERTRLTSLNRPPAQRTGYGLTLGSRLVSIERIWRLARRG